MAYTGKAPYKKAFYEKLIEAGVDEEDADLLVHVDSSLSGRVRTKWDIVREEGIPGLLRLIKSKL